MAQAIKPETIAAASLVIQILLLLIAYVTLQLLERSYSMRGAAKSSYSTLVAWGLLAFLMVMFGQDLYTVWQGLFEKLTFPPIPRDYSFLAVFLLNITFAAILIIKTGGSKRSPFSSVLLLLPSLAIFLREPVSRFLFYSLVVAVVYIVLLSVSWKPKSSDYERGSYDAPAKEDEAVDNWANIWANMSCLALATLIGYITQP